jgi:hypothetical protein
MNILYVQLLVFQNLLRRKQSAVFVSHLGHILVNKVWALRMCSYKFSVCDNKLLQSLDCFDLRNVKFMENKNTYIVTQVT